ncbi:hypothetical protein BDW59DRAFT_18569 [Aspergillus cavernicola]|uniref:Transmembrane protein n=1 Tax=Aspergillus cavernicola TaxID=176166 RepID=A0ABR4IS06_9EURO
MNRMNRNRYPKIRTMSETMITVTRRITVIPRISSLVSKLVLGGGGFRYGGSILAGFVSFLFFFSVFLPFFLLSDGYFCFDCWGWRYRVIILYLGVAVSVGGRLGRIGKSERGC